MTPDQVRQIIKEELAHFRKDNRYTIDRLMQFLDGRSIQAGVTTGLKIGTATTQKLALHGVTPVVQAGAISAPASQGGTYNQSDVQSIVTAVNSIRVALTNKGITA